MTVFYFSATGNSLSVAKKIGSIISSIPQELHDMKEKGSDHIIATDSDAVGIVFPVYFGRLPRPVKEFIECLKTDAPYVFAVMTYGEIAGCAASDFVRTARRSGLSPAYVRTLKMVDNNFSVVNVEKQVRTQGRKHIAGHLSEIVYDIRHRRRFVERPGIIDRITSFVEDRMTAEDAPRRFSVETYKCTGCGICAKVCPMANLSMTDGRPTWGDNCLKCTACYHNCPQEAIRYRGEKSRYTYRNSDVSLEEIILSNCTAGRK